MFEILPDLTTDHRGSCPLGSKKSRFSLFLVCYLSDPFKFVGIKDMHNTYYLGGDQLSTICMHICTCIDKILVGIVKHHLYISLQHL